MGVLMGRGGQDTQGDDRGGQDGVHTPGRESSGGTSPAHTVISDFQALGCEYVSAVEATAVRYFVMVAPGGSYTG